MTTTATKNFLGIPIYGDINPGGKRAPQKPLSELEPMIRAVLADDYIDSFGWTQYTPYFNDGEACEFSVGEPWFRTVDDVKAKPVKADDDDDDDDDYYDDYDDYNYRLSYSGHPTLGKQDYEWENGTRVLGPYQGNHETSYTTCSALADAISSGAYEDVLLEAFGDHTTVKVTRTGITIQEYSHE